MRIPIILIIGLFIIITLSNHAAASSFNVQTIICTPDWYCSTWSSTTCGTRSCVDANSCGVLTDKPSEYLACPASPSGGGGGVSEKYYPQTPPMFQTNIDFLDVSVKQDQTLQRLLTITSPVEDRYTLVVQMLSDESLIRLQPSEYFIRNKTHTFNLIIDAAGIKPGVYTALLNISNTNQSRTINVLVRVGPVTSELEVALFTSGDLIVNDTAPFLKTILRLEDSLLGKEVVVNYTIYGPDGQVITRIDKLIPNLSEKELIADFEFSAEAKTGYYSISAEVYSENRKGFIDRRFSVVHLNKYAAVERPSAYNRPNKFSWTILVASLTMFAIGSLIYFQTFRKHFRENSMIRKEQNVLNYSPETRTMHENGRMKTLWKARERGFISDKEYKELTGQKEIMISKADRFFDKVAEHRSFHVYHGPILRSLKDLCGSLDVMPMEVFIYHVTVDKNDFASWIRNVIKDNKLAETVKSAKTPKEMKNLIEGYFSQ